MTQALQTFGGDNDRRSWASAMLRGASRRCPQCGRGAIFKGYVKTREACGCCGLDLTGHRADDAPPYITILIVGHLVVPSALAVKQLFDPPIGLQFAIWLPVMIILAGALLPAAKGAMIGLQWANRMHGFGDGDEDD